MRRQLLVLLCLGAAGAWADLPPPDVSGCSSKAAGDACTRDDGSAGTCADATCSRNDYSDGPPPKTVEYPCLKCGAATARAPAPPPPKPARSCAAAPGLGLAGLATLLFARRRSRA